MTPKKVLIWVLISKWIDGWCPTLSNTLTCQHAEDPDSFITRGILVQGVVSVPGEDVLLCRGELYVLHRIMLKSHLFGEFWASPERDTWLVKGNHIRSLWGPLDFPIAPNLFHLLLPLTPVLLHWPANSRVVPAYLCLLLISNEELLSALLVQEPVSKVGSGEGVQSPLWHELLRSLDDGVKIIKFDYLERVVLVQHVTIQH
mmetsp:Transcript_33351/g.76090  ORF Transcript_33351/g.76090 Transcript_33351/m.76090 type:complete len:202 (-) Transcript_33351:378-983(-)